MKKILVTQAMSLLMVCTLQNLNGLCQEPKGGSPNKVGIVSDASDSENVTSLVSQLRLWHVGPQNFNDIVIHFTLNVSLSQDAKDDPPFYRSTDGGQTWQWVRFNELRNVDRIWPHGFSPFNPPIEYRFLLDDQGWLSVSPDGRDEWQKIEPEVETLKGKLHDKIIDVLTRDPHDVNTFYIYVLGGPRDDNHYGYFKTIDRGRHFRKLDFDFSSLWISPLNRTLMFAWSDEKGLHQSVDGGRRWKKINTHEFFTKQIEEELEAAEGKLTKIRSYLTVRQVAFDPQYADTLYVITYKGILKTTTGGRDWQRINVKLPPGALGSAVLVVNPMDGRKLYLASDYDLRRSDDGGRTWRILPTPELPKLLNPPR